MKLKFVRIFALSFIVLILIISFSSSLKVNAQCAVPGTQKILVEQGLISAPTLAPFKVDPANVSCVGGENAKIPQIAVLGYGEMKTLYFDQAKSNIDTIVLPLTGPGSMTQQTPNDVIDLTKIPVLYRITGSLTIDSNILVNATGVVFVDGDLYINSNLTNTSSTTGLVFIVWGKIFINPAVETINAFLVSYQGFCSAYQPSLTPNCQDFTGATQQKQLTINGSVISLSTFESPQFVRQKATALKAAETINYQPKYLVILKDIFARDLKVWKEVQ